MPVNNLIEDPDTLGKTDVQNIGNNEGGVELMEIVNGGEGELDSELIRV